MTINARCDSNYPAAKPKRRARGIAVIAALGLVLATALSGCFSASLSNNGYSVTRTGDLRTIWLSAANSRSAAQDLANCGFAYQCSNEAAQRWRISDNADHDQALHLGVFFRFEGPANERGFLVGEGIKVALGQEDQLGFTYRKDGNGTILFEDWLSRH